MPRVVAHRRRGLLAFFVVCVVAACGCRAEPQKGPRAEASQSSAVPPAASQPAQAGTVASLSPADQAPAPEATAGFDGRRAYAHVERLVAIGPRSPGTDGIRRAQEYIVSQLRSFGCGVEEDNFHASTPTGSVAMKNILAKVPGTRPGVVLLATHYDTKRMPNFIGANDGGSSTGLMLELARVLCARRGPLAVWIAFFDGEEAFAEWSSTDGTYGSRQMAAKLAVSGELKRIKAMMLADLIGDRNLRVKRETSSTRWLTDLVWSVAARLGYGNIFVSEETQIEDDHLPFLRRDVPAVDVIDLEAPYWHTGGDTLDKISPRSLAIVGHVFLESLTELEKKLH